MQNTKERDYSVIKIQDTQDIVRDLQRKAGLDPRGIVGNRILGVRPR